jgi:capsular exopolysaccharide synthesis family protein
MILGIVVGLGFGVGLAFFIEYLDTSVKTLEEVESLLKVPVLAVIPKNISLLINGKDDNPDSEAYRIMRTNIEFNRKSPSASSITIVSGGPGEGKSTTLNNLAYTFAKGGYTTLLVDADLRRPSQHRIFGVDNKVGLSDYLTKNYELEDVVKQSKIDNLYFLPSGLLPSDAVGILNSQRMLDMIQDAKSRFDIVFFDSPPILGVSDASVLSSEVDLTIIVVQHRRFPKSMLQRVKLAVDNVGGKTLGVVLNNVDIRHDQSYEYYTSYYNYYHKAVASPQKKRTESNLESVQVVEHVKSKDKNSEY